MLPALKVLRYEETPNPNAIKCVLSGQVAQKPASFRSAESAAGHPLATALFAIEGVCGVLLLDDWMTISRTPGRAWGPIRSGIERALRQTAKPATDPPTN